MNWKILSAGASCATFVVAMVVVLYLIHLGEWAVAEALAAAVVGGGAGWAVGIYLSPYDKRERQEFSEFAKTITAVSGGAAVTQALNVLVKAIDQGYLWKGMFWHPFMLMVGAFFTAMVVTFGFRKYAG